MSSIESSNSVNPTSISGEHCVDDITMTSPAENTIDGKSLDGTNEDVSKKNCCLTHIQKARLEYLTALFMFAYVLTKITTTTLIVDKVCLNHFGYPEEICQNLSDDNYSDIKASIVKVSTNYQLGCSLIQNLPATLLSLFLGPWSDKYGRKLPMIIGLLGLTIGTFGSSVCAYFLDSRVEYLFIPIAFTGLFGGTVSLLTLVYSYASDTTTLQTRTMKFGFIELFKGLAQGGGSAVGGWIYKLCGYAAVFYLSAGVFFLSLIWAIFMITETRGQDNTDPIGVKVKQLFRCKTLKESFIATAKERPNRGRRQIVLLIISMCYIAIAVGSTGDINFLYVQYVFDWDNTTFSTISSIYTGIAIGILIFVVPLFRYLKTGDVKLGLFGSVSIFLQFLTLSVAFKPAIYHIANILGMLAVCASMAARSRISKLISPDELGKVFLFVAAAESLLPLLTTILVSQVFTASIPAYPAAPYSMLATFMLVPLSVFIWMKCLPPMSYKEMQEDSEAEIQTEASKSV